jgi:hypothetical protein
LSPIQEKAMPGKFQFEDPTFDEPPADGGEVAYQPADSPSESPVGAVLHKHEAQLRMIPGVKGVGESLGPIGEPVIQVFIAHAGVAKALPQTLDGIGVMHEVVGEIDAYAGKPRHRQP